MSKPPPSADANGLDSEPPQGDRNGALSRRTWLSRTGAGLAVASGCDGAPQASTVPPAPEPVSSHSAGGAAPGVGERATQQSPLIQKVALGPAPAPWPTFDPFLFCVHHDDAYPQGNSQLGPAASLGGRSLGQDFAGKDGWRMYHGSVIPGFPQHPHRGFETVTIAQRGHIDHSDSLGATARYGPGDVQWMTAGRGIEHAEMFPLLHEAQPNPLELFQIWLNLPARSKFAEPHFSMFWAESIPELALRDAGGRVAHVRVIAGQLATARPLAPPPDSWAAQANSDLAIWLLRLEPGAQVSLPPARLGTGRTLYFVRGGGAQLGSMAFGRGDALRLRPEAPLLVTDQGVGCELLLLQGRPIAEPVAHQGPFVMNTRQQILEAFQDYRQTRFGGWRWPSSGPVHARAAGRFAQFADGRIERAKQSPAAG